MRGERTGWGAKGPGARAPWVLLVLLGVAGAAGCARSVAPTGGTVPDLPPQVVGTSPDTFALVSPFRGPVRIDFDRTLAERLVTGNLRDAVVVSPRTGEVSVRQRGRRLEISMEGGFQSDAVYRITVLPRFQDRYRNLMDRPVEIFFSTGPDFEDSLVAGLVTDLITGDELPGTRVDAIPLEEGPTYSAVADSLGVFAFRFLPSGAYRVVAYDDVNRNRAPDFQERQAATQVTVGPADTLVVSELELLLPDTTAAVLVSATPLDSVTVELTFDDPLDPNEGVGGIRALLTPPTDPADDEEVVPLEVLPRIVEITHGPRWDARRAAGDRPSDDDPDTPPDPDDPEAGPPAEPQERLRPDSRLIVRFDAPLPAGVRLRIVVEGVENLAGIPDGWGEATFTTPEAPEPEEDPDPPDPPDAPEPPDAAASSEAAAPPGTAPSPGAARIPGGAAVRGDGSDAFNPLSIPTPP